MENEFMNYWDCGLSVRLVGEHAIMFQHCIRILARLPSTRRVIEKKAMENQIHELLVSAA